MEFEDETDNGGTKSRGRPFPPGESGNRAGRPKGSRNRSTLILQELIAGDLEAIVGKAKQVALDGNPAMLQTFLKPLLRREPPINFELPDLHSPADAVKVMRNLLQNVSQGEITLAEAERVSRVVEVYLNALEVDDFERRLGLVEEWRHHLGKE